MSNLRAEPSTRRYCTDAAPFGAGICSCEVPLQASTELLRFADHKGFYTALEPRLASNLDQFALGPSEVEVEPIPRALSEGILFDVCEMFRGRGSLLRSRAVPWGFDPNDSRTREGNHLASRVGYILHLAAAYGILTTAEQPLGSVLFQLDIFQRLLERGFFTVDFSCCAFGTPFQRPTRLLANNPALRELAVHLPLSGPALAFGLYFRPGEPEKICGLLPP
ncbi:hypothetical protein AK812_SmicGene7499 [Symbiodinium microadriaticum]|uniref:Uncharacterized protein n=1 Tax=Symbiodinium microadriaticum TaxID=2951 RepID=A0A1Q9ENF4_SYMMI|nr:hypothetical protein AK812_SmicGene7499 [Symbiodinium microadriaticum]